ncbi:MAG TPA: DUF4907 domain-containing protein [Flavobacteriales bacterium]|nr:DUF4907 domain-containing protein [Flavobacteriales bacterium]
MEQGLQRFRTKHDAQKAAELVIHKLRNNILPPSISIEELKDLGILDCLSS